MAKKTKGPGDGKKKAPASKSKDTISPYYATMKYGGPLEKSAAKKSMKGYFSGSKANTSGETESQHMSRMSKRDTIPAARKSGGVYKASAFGGSSSKKSYGRKK